MVFMGVCLKVVAFLVEALFFAGEHFRVKYFVRFLLGKVVVDAELESLVPFVDREPDFPALFLAIKFAHFSTSTITYLPSGER
jgi:hypothetical protein